MIREPPVRDVVVIGTGLIGTSVGLALRRCGVDVRLSDRDPQQVRMAEQLGAGTRLHERSPRADIAVIAVPPRAVAATLLDAQRRGIAHTFTDVASVKVRPLDHALRLGCDLSSYAPGHPMAGSEGSGAAAARPDLFVGRPWVLCPTPRTATGALSTAAALARLCGGEPVVMDAPEHDRAMVFVSHIPHVAASITAARLMDADPDALRLAGKGLGDVTRTAGADPELWTDILTANPLEIAKGASEMAAAFSALATALRAAAAGDDRAVQSVSELLDRGHAGRARLPAREPDALVVTGGSGGTDGRGGQGGDGHHPQVSLSTRGKA